MRKKLFFVFFLSIFIFSPSLHGVYVQQNKKSHQIKSFVWNKYFLLGLGSLLWLGFLNSASNEKLQQGLQVNSGGNLPNNAENIRPRNEEQKNIPKDDLSDIEKSDPLIVNLVLEKPNIVPESTVCRDVRDNNSITPKTTSTVSELTPLKVTRENKKDNENLKANRGTDANKNRSHIKQKQPHSDKNNNISASPNNSNNSNIEKNIFPSDVTEQNIVESTNGKNSNVKTNSEDGTLSNHLNSALNTNTTTNSQMNNLEVTQKAMSSPVIKIIENNTNKKEIKKEKTGVASALGINSKVFNEKKQYEPLKEQTNSEAKNENYEEYDLLKKYSNYTPLWKNFDEFQNQYCEHFQ